jgi:hypothetical protein
MAVSSFIHCCVYLTSLRIEVDCVILTKALYSTDPVMHASYLLGQINYPFATTVCLEARFLLVCEQISSTVFLHLNRTIPGSKVEMRKKINGKYVVISYNL